MGWINDIKNPKRREWEEHYRNRWSYDKVVRSTHGVNCTGSCSWNIFVKNGIVAWELQAQDYPRFSKEVPPYEPRGCQRGISFSEYQYSDLRVKYPYIRGRLLKLWREAKLKFPENLVKAWASIQENPSLRTSYQEVRGKGGLKRISWDEVREIIAAANIYTIQKFGSDRIAGFSPIPAMSMVSYAAGARYVQLMGGFNLSFYDWYCDLPPASPEIWGEQTDVAESADWYHSKFIAIVGSNVLMTRTPDAHFLTEARHNGSKVVVFSPDLNMTAKAGDQFIPLHQGQDSAFWMAVTHVLLKEYFGDKETSYFNDYIKQFTDAPFLVKLEGDKDSLRPGKLLRASEITLLAGEENDSWKGVVFDRISKEVVVPKGTLGHRWQEKKGNWNLKLENSQTDAKIDPELSFLGTHDELLKISLSDFSEGTSDKQVFRDIPVKKVKGTSGDLYVTTGLDLLFAQYGVSRNLTGEYPKDYNDENLMYTPAWQEKFTGVDRETVITFAREWGRTAEITKGKCSVIIGAGVNHWYHNNLIYRSIITALMITGSVGVNGGGLNHYVGQEKLAPQASWAPFAFGADWGAPPRQQNAPSFHYFHSDQWRYDPKFQPLCPVSDEKHNFTQDHTVDKNIEAVRNGWMPCYPQFNLPNHEIYEQAVKKGANSEEEVIKHLVSELKNKNLKFSFEDPDAPENFPRLFYIWRGNALMSSAKGHEYFLKHYLGASNNTIASEIKKENVREIAWHDTLPVGKMDLVIDVNFRMDTSALYSDIILPTATFYEKNDLNSTDMHSFIHPLQKAVDPSWESLSDWDIFKSLAEATQKLAVKLNTPAFKDIIALPIMHDTPGEMAQEKVANWHKGECEAIPGKTMPSFKVTERDLKLLYNKFISLGNGIRENGLGMHGLKYEIKEEFDDYLKNSQKESWNDKSYISLKNDIDACNYILNFSPETNGALAVKVFNAESKKTGLDLSHLAKNSAAIRYNFSDLIQGPKRLLTTPYWTGNINNGRTYSSYVLNKEELIPWRTLTGRQHFYLDHEIYIAYGENLPAHKPRVDASTAGDLINTDGSKGIILNYLTPHGKWSIHSTYGDLVRMKTLSRGVEPIWINSNDAKKAGIADNDWVEALNDNGAVVTRACISPRIPAGIALIYHSPERTLDVPKSPSRDNKRAGGHNSLTRVRLKPLFMIGGYAQFTYAFNYWGPTGINRDTHVIIKKLDRLEY